MNIEDCEVGKEIESIYNKSGYKVYKISEIVGNKIGVEDYPGLYLPKYFRLFEPVNKFEVGDEVIYSVKPLANFKAKVFGISDKKDIETNGKYAITYKDSRGRIKNRIVRECDLSPLKKPDELEVGDKFEDYSGNTVKILARENNPVNTTYYFGRTNSENIDVWTHYDVREIIYD